MTVEYGGSLTLGQCIPMALAAQAQLDVAIGVSLPSLQAKLAGALAAQLNLTTNPPTLAANLSAALALVASIQASIVAGLPSVDFQLTALAAIIADIELQIGSLTASASFSLNFLALLGSPGVRYYLYEGRADQLGSGMTAELSAGLPGGAGPSETIAGVILTANDGGTIEALRTVLRA
jgi:hypothetical protein